MRGKANAIPENLIEERITPAYAGKRTGHTSSVTSCGDHPRLCGEKDTIAKLKKAG